MAESGCFPSLAKILARSRQGSILSYFSVNLVVNQVNHSLATVMQIVDLLNTEHYLWGKGCDGWHLLKRDDMSVIFESVPTGECERRHYHERARQFFYILTGMATIEVAGEIKVLRAQQGIEIPPGVTHQFRNESSETVTFLVISVPKSHGDRLE
jgi:mannose-6-phosphate isomerase-like protein (cupin superfamily)